MVLAILLLELFIHHMPKHAVFEYLVIFELLLGLILHGCGILGEFKTKILHEHKQKLSD